MSSSNSGWRGATRTYALAVAFLIGLMLVPDVFASVPQTVIFSDSSVRASAQLPSSNESPGTNRFFFRGRSSTGEFALGAGTISPSSSVHGVGLVSSPDRESLAIFTLTGKVFCSGGPPPGKPCLGLDGKVLVTVGDSMNGAKAGDPVVVILVENTDHSGSICVILPAPGLRGTCDNFVGTVSIP